CQTCTVCCFNEYLCKCCRPFGTCTFADRFHSAFHLEHLCSTFNYGFSVLLHVIIELGSSTSCFDFKICTASNDISSAACMQFPNVNACCTARMARDSI